MVAIKVLRKWIFLVRCTSAFSSTILHFSQGLSLKSITQYLPVRTRMEVTLVSLDHVTVSEY